MRHILIILALFATTNARAQVGGLQMDAVSGNWIAVHHSQDDIHTDVCFAGSVDHRLMFRADAEDIEVRTSDSTWSLPEGTTGEMTVVVGPYNQKFDLTWFDTNTLVSIVKPDDIRALFDAMDKAPSAEIKYGSKTTKIVSLSGSTAAVNAFRGCVARSGFSDLGNVAGKSSTPF